MKLCLEKFGSILKDAIDQIDSRSIERIAGLLRKVCTGESKEGYG